MDAVFPLTSSLQVIYGLTPSSDSLWVEALGTPAYLKLLPGGSLPCACGLYVYSLRTVPQDTVTFVPQVPNAWSRPSFFAF